MNTENAATTRYGPRSAVSERVVQRGPLIKGGGPHRLKH